MKSIFTRTELWLIILLLAILVGSFLACDHVYANWQP